MTDVRSVRRQLYPLTDYSEGADFKNQNKNKILIKNYEPNLERKKKV